MTVLYLYYKKSFIKNFSPKTPSKATQVKVKRYHLYLQNSKENQYDKDIIINLKTQSC